MKKTPLVLAIILGVCLGTGLYLLMRRPPPAGPDRAGTSAEMPNPDRRPLSPRHVLTSSDLSPPDIPAVRPVQAHFRPDSDEPPELNRFPSRDRIRGEYLFSFYDDRDREAFIRAARALGINVLDRLSLGHSVRLRIPSRQLLQQLLQQGPEPVEYGANYYVRVPRRIEDQDPRAPQTGYIAFGDATLPWLGVQGDNATWGRGVTIAVLDSGVGQHDAMPESQIVRLDLLDDGSPATDTHATAVASLLIGQSGGINGVVPAADILSIRVLAGDGSGDVFTFAGAIVEATDRGSDVINISLGSYGDSYLLREAIDYATENGVVIVASTGNDAIEGVTYPAAYDDVIAVGAVDGAAQHVYFSNRGDEVDLAAPGIGLYAAGGDNSTVMFSGTSAASPLVAGTVGALLASDPGLSAEEAVNIVLGNTDDHGAPGTDDEYGSGTLNVGRIADRDTPGIYDVAVGDAYVETGDGAIDLTLYVQNRGTEPLLSVDMTVTIDGVSSLAGFSNLGLGETASQTYNLVSENLSSYGEIRVSYEAEIDGHEDSNPANNAVSGAVTLVTP